MATRSCFRRDENGVVAIEFAILAVPFFVVMFAITEVALVLTASMQFENATERVSRRVMTGELKRDQASVRQAVCNEVVFAIDCSKLRIDYREIASLKDFALVDAVTDRKINASAFAFQTVASPSFASLRVGYEWPITFKPMAAFMAGLDNGRTFLLGTSLMRIET